MTGSPGTPPTLAGLHAAAGAVAGVLAEPAAWQLCDADLLAGLDAAYRLATAAHTVGIALLVEVDQRKLPIEAGASSTQAWLAATRRLSPGEAHRDVMLAGLLAAAATDGIRAPSGSDPDATVEGAVLAGGLAAGGVNLDQAGRIAAALGELPPDANTATRVAAERVLVDQAGWHGPAALTRLGHRIAERVDPDAADARLGAVLEREERQANRLRCGTRYADGHGNVVYRFQVPVGADAFVRPVLDTLARPERAGPNGEQDVRTGGQRLADAFVEAFRRLSLTGNLPEAGGDRPRVVVTIDHDTLVSGLGGGSIIDTGDQVSVAAVRRLACDAQIIPAILGGDGQLLDLGRARRTFDGPIRTAVIVRDGGCVHPGCDRPARWCDVHHVVPWWKHGKTSLDNGVLLCGYHHKLYDNGEWTIRFSDTGIPESIPPPWVDPDQYPRRHERFLERLRL